MPRLLGVDIPNDKATVISLTYLYGVGPKVAQAMARLLGILRSTFAVRMDSCQIDERVHMPNLCRFFDDANADFLCRCGCLLLQSNRSRESGRPSADDDNVVVDRITLSTTRVIGHRAYLNFI